MALPLLTTGLKLFQATRSKGSPQSTTQTTTVDGAANLGATMKAAPAGQRRSSTPSISISKFLPQSSAPQKDVKFKDRRYKPLGDVVNSITKSFASILSIFKADDKLSRRQADDQRQKNAADAKTARESKLEGQNKFSPLKTISNKISQSGSWLDKLITFIASIALGSLVLAIYKNFTGLIQFFRDTYETILDFFKKLGEYISPIHNIFKWITTKFLNIFSKVKPNEDKDYAEKIDRELEANQKVADNLEKVAGVTANETEEIDSELSAAKMESDDDNEALKSFQEFVSFMGNMVLPGSAAVAGTMEGQPMREDRPFAKEMIKEHEGLRLDKYLDSKGLPTIGYGHLIDESDPDLMNMPLGETISQERANELFERDFNEHLFAAQKIPGFFRASKRQQAALIDLTFNMGPNWYKGFPSFTKAFAAGDYNEAARQLEFADPDNKPGVPSGYVMDVGRRSDPILKLIKDQSLKNDSYLKNIEHLLSRQTISNNKLSDAIASISTNEEEFSDEPLVIPVPQHQLTVKGGSSPKVQYIPIGSESGLNSNKITRAKLAAV
jgi:GH24 family phage-related lysozyme (muramidase)